jgi:predicted dehydrogenase
MKFNENLMGKVFVSTGCKRDYTMRTVIYGTKGTLICDNTSPTMTLFTVDENEVTKEAETIEIQVNNHNAVKEFQVFADAILNNKEILTDATEGAKTVAVCLAIVESAKTGEKVKPNYEF